MLNHYYIVVIIFFVSCNHRKHVSHNDFVLSDSLTHQSKLLLEKNKLDSASILINRALALDPENYVAYNNRACLKVKGNRPKEDVIQDYKIALKLKPNYEISIYSLANYYFEKEDYDNAIDFSNQFIELKKLEELGTKETQQIYIVKGVSEKYIDKFYDATINLHKALKLNLNNAWAHKELADCYAFENKDLALAIKEYTLAIKLDTNYCRAYLGRGNCFENTEPPAMNNATNDYKKALKIDPNLEDYYNTGSLLLKRLRSRNEE